MHVHEALIHQFYNAFSEKDYRTMQNAYHAEATFSDPVFQELNSNEVKAMWHMLLSGSTDLTIVYSKVKANDFTGTCHWEAHYTFTLTGKKVHNIINAEFEFKDGRIFRHRDQFDFWRWSRMALGLKGLLLGWSPIVLQKVRATARKRLDKWMMKA